MNENPYKSPTPSAAASDKLTPSILTKTATMFARHAALALVIGLLLYFVVAAFEKTFVELNFKLPEATLLVVTMSRFVVSYWYLLLFLIPIYFILLLGIQASGRRASGLVLAWSALFWLSGIALLVTILLAVILPLRMTM